MAEITAREARQQLADMLNRVSYNRERLVITRRRKRLAVLVPIEDLEILEALEDRIDLEDARKALAEIEAGAKPIPWTKLRKELGL